MHGRKWLAGRARGGISALLLVLGAAFLLLIWGTAQQWVGATVRRRVQIAHGSRRAALLASQAVEEAVDLFRILANEGEGSLAQGLRRLRPGRVLEVHFDAGLALPPEAAAGDLRADPVLLRAWIRGVRPSTGPPPPDLDCRAYGAALRRWATRPVSPLQQRREELELFGDWRPPEIVGLLELRATVHAERSRVRVTRRATVRRQFGVQVAPCPEQVVEALGRDLRAYVRVHPVELGRVLESDRRPVGLVAPPEEERP